MSQNIWLRATAQLRERLTGEESLVASRWSLTRLFRRTSTSPTISDNRPTTGCIYNLRMFSALLGLGVAAAGSAAGYQSMAPTGQWYGRTFTGLKRGSRQIALTYDDGPNDPHTLRLLEVLARHRVRATFFMIGRYVRQRPDIVLDVARAGHVIGSPRAHVAPRFARFTRGMEWERA